VLDRASLAGGAILSGPAILLEETATTYLDAGWRAEAHPTGSLFIEQEG
jgi:N-methylhydantoinase A/oxoprolinase/acetone carboxylase beta subunit